MIPEVDRLTVTNFRSVKGSIWIPLDAPIILIHGPNGAGKTSVLSALELGLTGDVAALRRDDPTILNHLIHQGAASATVKLTGPGLVGEAGTPGVLTVASGKVSGRALLDEAHAQFFAERCYLAQTVLGRLLEIYQHADPQKDSALTRFVKDLLGLDQLDALVDGLHDAGDIRRTRNLAPEFRAADERCKSLRARRQRAELARAQSAETLASERRRFGKLIAALPSEIVGAEPPVGDVESMKNLLARAVEDAPLVTLDQHRRELNSLRNAWSALPADLSAKERISSEVEETEAAAALAAWRNDAGAKLERLLDSLRNVFPDLPSSASTDPKTAHATAAARVAAEIRRLEETLAQDRAAAAQISRLDKDVGRAEARIKIVDEQLTGLAVDVNGLSQALAALTPHIHGEDCPVCGRDFSEVSEQPLISYVQKQIARLSEQAGRLSALALEKSDVTARLSALQRERETEVSKRLSQEDHITLQARLANLTNASSALGDIASSAAEGARHLLRFAKAQQRLAQARERDRSATDLRATTATLCVALRQPELGKSENLGPALDRLQKYVADEQSRLEGVQNARLEALAAARQLAEAQATEQQARAEAAALAAELDRESKAFNAADKRRLQAKAIGQAARDARTAIVRRVFNDSLNALWRDLFVRLAPTEPFIPAFKLPETADGVVAALETLTRSGQRGGTPGAMLSAGNLNTAALTLFLALHLSVEARLPWLVLDDPVQSMDEVHIAQFAALLRTLSKGHGRKMLIAVQDRPLFDYLSLELSPAFPQDQLITVELSRSASDITIAESRYWTFKKDGAIAA